MSNPLTTVECSCGRTIGWRPGSMARHLRSTGHRRRAAKLLQKQIDALPEHPRQFMIGDHTSD